MTSPYGTTVPLLKDVKSQAPQAICELTSTNVSRNLILNREKPPFDNPDLRRAMALSLDRKAFIDILSEGKGDIGGDDAAAARRGVGHAAGDADDTARLRSRCREEPRRSPQDHGEARLRPGQAARGHGVDAQHPGLPRSGGDPDRPAEGDLHRRRARTDRDRQLVPQDLSARTTRSAINGTESGVDDPDQQFYENYVCGAERNYTGYCNPEVDKLIDRQSIEADPEKRKQLVWEIERKLAEDGARPIIFYPRGGTCWQPYVKGLTTMVNSIYNG